MTPVKGPFDPPSKGVETLRLTITALDTYLKENSKYQLLDP